MNNEPNCIFCRIVAGDAPAIKVFEDEHTLTFMDVMPQSDGHTLVITKTHVEDIFALDGIELYAPLMAATRKIALAARQAFEAPGIMITQLNGRAAGQTVSHYHTHVIPRFEGQALGMHAREPEDIEKLQMLGKKLRAEIAKL